MEQQNNNTAATANATATQAAQNEARFPLRIFAVAGIEEGEAASKESATYWLGRKVGKAPRKDLQLSIAIPQVSATEIAALDPAKLALLLNDEFAAYIRRVKCQRIEIGAAIELMLPSNAQAFAELALAMLTAPAQRAKKLVSAASIRALLLSSEYKAAALAAFGDKLATWQRIGEREMLPLAYAADAKVATDRADVRDKAVIRMLEIATMMPEGNEGRVVLEAASELLAEVPTVALDDSI